jgi:high-affinity K+ transport system ATPase subunit B
MTERSVSELRDECLDRLHAVGDEGMTLAEIAREMSIDEWLAEAILTRLVISESIVTSKESGHLRFLTVGGRA